MQHSCAATDQSHLPHSSLSECVAFTLGKCWAIENDFISMQFASEMFLAFCTVAHCIQLNGQM